MPENLLCPKQKASTPAFREGWDRVFRTIHEGDIKKHPGAKGGKAKSQINQGRMEENYMTQISTVPKAHNQVVDAIKIYVEYMFRKFGKKVKEEDVKEIISSASYCSAPKEEQ